MFLEVEAAIAGMACDVSCAVMTGLCVALLLCAAPILAVARGFHGRAVVLGACVPSLALPDRWEVCVLLWVGLLSMALLPRRRDRIRVTAPT